MTAKPACMMPQGIMHGGEAAIHDGVSRHVPALQVPSQEGRCRQIAGGVDGVELTPMRGT